jgi:hypothetical protein
MPFTPDTLQTTTHAINGVTYTHQIEAGTGRHRVGRAGVGYGTEVSARQIATYVNGITNVRALLQLGWNLLGVFASSSPPRVWVEDVA